MYLQSRTLFYSFSIKMSIKIQNLLLLLLNFSNPFPQPLIFFKYSRNIKDFSFKTLGFF